MRTRRRLLHGDLVEIDVPDATELPGGTAVSVLLVQAAAGEQELEVTGGTAADRDHYLGLSGTRLTGTVSLRTGGEVRYGRYGDDPAQGVAFALGVGEHWVYGFTTPGTDAETLAGTLARVSTRDTPEGAVLEPGGDVGWSPHRAHVVTQVVRLADDPDGGERGYLLDVRRAPGAGDRDSAGVEVRGGLLSRSAVEERHAYAVLEAPDFVSYGIPGGAEQLDLVASSLAQVTTELVAEAG